MSIGGCRRIVDDLTSYYLLGYYSTNSKPDGRFRKITVRVKRPGVNVRARRGYRAPSEEELALRSGAGPAAGAGPTPRLRRLATAVNTALGALAMVRTDVPVRFLVGYRVATRTIPASGAPPGAGAQLWVTGELDVTRATEGWRDGGEATITVTKANRRTVGSTTALSRTTRGFRVVLPEQPTLGPGTYDVRISARSSKDARRRQRHSASPCRRCRPARRRRSLGAAGDVETRPVHGHDVSAGGRPAIPAAGVDSARGGAGGRCRGSVARVLDRTGHALGIPVKTSSRRWGRRPGFGPR